MQRSGLAVERTITPACGNMAKTAEASHSKTQTFPHSESVAPAVLDLQRSQCALQAKPPREIEIKSDNYSLRSLTLVAYLQVLWR
jgi:hypothetical protein